MTGNLPLLRRVAGGIEPLLDDLVFVGGAVVELYLSRPISERIRPTKDTDAVVRVVSRVEYRRLGRRLEGFGFSQSAIHGDPPYRWRSPAGDILDLMPIDDDILGFTNRWYEPGVERAVRRDLEGLWVRVLSAPYYLASKLEAHQDRGSDDPFGSKDFADAVVVLGSRPEIVEEIAQAEPELRDWMSHTISALFPRDRVAEYLSAHLPVRSVAGLLDEVEDQIERIRRDPS